MDGALTNRFAHVKVFDQVFDTVALLATLPARETGHVLYDPRVRSCIAARCTPTTLRKGVERIVACGSSPLRPGPTPATPPPRAAGHLHWNSPHDLLPDVHPSSPETARSFFDLSTPRATPPFGCRISFATRPPPPHLPPPLRGQPPALPIPSPSPAGPPVAPLESASGDSPPRSSSPRRASPFRSPCRPAPPLFT